MKQAKYWRKGNVLGWFDKDGNRIEEKQFKSINAAKKHSRELQKGSLGQGLLRVIR